jgi:hypothetical protein
MMTVVTLMATALDQELQARGIFSLSRADCEAVMQAVLARGGKIAAGLPEVRKMGKPS